MKKILFYFFFIFYSSFLVSQNYDNINVDNNDSYDTESITNNSFRILLHEVSINGVSIPIYMTYNSTGTKVNDLPNSVGYNWELHAGGEINKKVNHLPDESIYGWFFDQNRLTDYQVGLYFNNSLAKDLYYSVDSQPDLFEVSLSNGNYLNFLFFLDENNQLSPKIIHQNGNNFSAQNLYLNKDLMLQYSYTGQYVNPYLSDDEAEIHIIDNKGTHYKFRKGIKRKLPYDILRQQTVDSSFYNNYYLHKIHRDSNEDYVNFEYIDSDINKLIYHKSATRYRTNSELQTPPSHSDLIVTEGFYEDVSIEDNSRKEISKIQTNKETIVFKYINDIYYNSFGSLYISPTFENGTIYQQLKLLDEIEIYDHNNKYIYGYKFNYTTQTENQEDFEGFLRLKSIHRFGKNHIDLELFKEFNYYNFSQGYGAITTAQDVYGYPNAGDIFNSCQISVLDLCSNRMPDLSKMTQGMLKSVTNVYGGKTEFIYAENTYEDTYYGGLLVNQINKLDKNGNIIEKTEYEYEDPEGTGLEVYSDWELQNQGDLPPNIYDDGYFEGLSQGSKGWHTYFTKKDPLMEYYSYNYLTGYNVSNLPYAFYRNTPYLDQILTSLNIPPNSIDVYGSFYKKITSRKLNIENDIAEKGYKIVYFRPQLIGELLNKIIEKVEIYDSSGSLVSEEINKIDTEYIEHLNCFEFDNTHLSRNSSLNLFRYVIKNKTVYNLVDVLKSKTKNLYTDSNLTKTYLTEYSYLNEGMSNVDYNRISLKKEYFNGLEYSKLKYKYFSEYDYPENLDISFLINYNPLIEKSKWIYKNSSWILNEAIISEYDEFYRLKRVTSIEKNLQNKSIFKESNYTPSYINSNSELINESGNTLEYEYDDFGYLSQKNNLKYNTSEIYQRSQEYNNLYVDAILTTSFIFNSNMSIFLKKSFENPSENDVIKFKKAFSGSYVFNGIAINLGEFPENYYVSYWAYENNNWVNYNFIHQGGTLIINKPLNIDYIDEILVLPSNSNIDSLTYIPLVGISSYLDLLGQGSRVYYDLFNRSIYSLDANGKVLTETRNNFSLNNY